MAFLLVFGFFSNAALAFTGGGWLFFFGGLVVQLSGVWLKAIRYAAPNIESQLLLSVLSIVPYLASLVGIGLIVWSGFELPFDIDRNYETSLWMVFLWLTGFLSTQKRHVSND